MDIGKLLLHIVRGEQDQAKVMLQKQPDLLLEKGMVTDFSFRTFIDVSALQCACWALDTRYMVDMMFQCIPLGELGDKIKSSLMDQFDYIQNKGIIYKFEGTLYRNSRYDFGIIPTLKNYITCFYDWDEKTRNECWLNLVGKEQRKLPSNVLQSYCNPEHSFEPSPNFQEEHFVRTSSVIQEDNPMFFDPNDNMLRFFSANGLGNSFAMLRGGHLDGARCYPNIGELDLDEAILDLAALQKLQEARMTDLTSLPQRLNINLKQFNFN